MSTQIQPPVAVHRHVACPECGHTDGAKKPPRFEAWLRERLGIRPAATRCAYVLSSVESGVGLPEPCVCTDAAHAR